MSALHHPSVMSGPLQPRITPKRPVREMLGSGPFHRPGAEAQRAELGRVLAGLCPGSVSPDKPHPRCLQAVCVAGMGGDG